jgi:membrane protein
MGEPSSTTRRRLRQPNRGRRARSPFAVPPNGWKDVLLRVRKEAKADRVGLLSAGVAFSALLAIVPALAALLSIYGLVADPADVDRQVQDVLGAAPQEVRDLVGSQLSSITTSSSAGLGVGVVVGLALALWAASSGVKNLVSAINTVYDEGEDRGFIASRGLALGLTLAAVVFVAAAFCAFAVVPALLDGSALGSAAQWAVSIGRWPVLGLALLGGLGVLYRLAPDRDDAGWRWVSPGALLAALIWLVASLGFSLYSSAFGSYNETYGTLAGVVVTMIWLQLSAAAVLLGAELNAELERQTGEDTTRGPEEPLGERGAAAADTVGPSANELARS